MSGWCPWNKLLFVIKRAPTGYFEVYDDVNKNERIRLVRLIMLCKYRLALLFLKRSSWCPWNTLFVIKCTPTGYFEVYHDVIIRTKEYGW